MIPDSSKSLLSPCNFESMPRFSDVFMSMVIRLMSVPTVSIVGL